MSNQTIKLTDPLYQYILDHSLRESEVCQQLRAETQKMEWSVMQIAPDQGQFMGFLIRMMGAKNIIEIGVYTGYSTLAMAYGLADDGKIIACDINKSWTDVAEKYWRKAGQQHKIELHLRPAAETLRQLLADNKASSFDFAFIDADKEAYDEYYELCLQLLVPGGVIAIDNVLWDGAVLHRDTEDGDTQAIQALNKKLKDDSRVDITMLPIGDGLTLARKKI